MSEKWSHFQWAFVLLPEHRRHRRRRQSAAAVQVGVALHILNERLENGELLAKQRSKRLESNPSYPVSVRDWVILCLVCLLDLP